MKKDSGNVTLRQRESEGKVTKGQRRIVNGEKVQEDKRYMVYLVQAENSKQAYKAWLCGGTLVTPLYIVTSAACVEDVVHMYAIAGYTKYVPAEQLNSDACTKEKKKKVIYVCIPRAYTFAYPDVQKWANLDMAVAKVESPYDFNDESYKRVCSYIPNQIEISYEKKYQQPGVDALVLGWGHKDKWRDTKDLGDHNSQDLLYGPVRIQDKETCKSQYTGHYEQLHPIIDKYMICTMSHGNIDSKGELIEKNMNMTDGCVDAYGIRSERNDHGGPLVTWIGSHEMLIGVASVFRINSTTSECIGPYLFTSTWCSSAFLHCIVTEKEDDNKNLTRRWEECDRPLKEQGITLSERDVSWMGHADGPADNENIQLRPQLPLHSVSEYRRDDEILN
ncbi:hypothetical protein MSG28_014216 [Choristoneura fumiferana]|uniref:Uncharacterized protein n=1 Tax=Choristoneura fumiferana TaxID=7141 RepID=A0ACC0JGC5_CHOFU|nr:hypothetical protein MSG28_014216 [Choristoneura fumiferana]